MAIRKYLSVRIAVSFLIALFMASNVSAGLYRRATGKRIKGRYIVSLRPETGDPLHASAALQKIFGGRRLGVMRYAMNGFGIALNEQQARALSQHPWVSMVEEDEEMYLASQTSPSVLTQATTASLRPELNANNCPWYGSYWMCTYSDPNVNWFWHLNRLDNQGYINSSQRTYAYASTGYGVRAYIVDSGVYAGHQEFDGRVEVGANMTMDPDLADQTRTDEEAPIFLDGAPAYNPCGGWQSQETNSTHGTGVASALGGTNTGVAKEVTIVPVKVMTCSGQMAKLAVARGLDWIQEDMRDLDHNPSNGEQPRSGRAVVNMSIWFPIETVLPTPGGTLEQDEMCEETAGSPYFTKCVSAIEHEINELMTVNLSLNRLGIPVVVSANNQGNDQCLTTPARMGYGGSHPSTYRTITVGGAMAFQSNNYVDERWICATAPGGCNPAYPNQPGSNHGPCVSIYAPGSNIRTASGTGPTSYRADGAANSGTSFAAPQVAGAIARLLQRYPTLTSTGVWTELQNRSNARWTQNNFDPTGWNTRLLFMYYNE